MANFNFATEVGIYKRKQESKKTRKHAFDQEKKKKERKHTLDQESDQEKKKKKHFFIFFLVESVFSYFCFLF